MSPEQRASLPYDHKVDVYSVGVMFLEMCYPLSTQMERVSVLSNLQQQSLPPKMVKAQPKLADFILWLTAPSSADRPSVDQVIASPLLSPRGTVRVCANRDSMHVLIPKVHALLDSVQRVRSFTVQDGEDDESRVSIEFFTDPPEAHEAGLPLDGEQHRLRLEALNADIAELDGVIQLTSIAQESSPRLSPSSGSSNGAAGATPKLPPDLPMLPPASMHPAPASMHRLACASVASPVLSPSHAATKQRPPSPVRGKARK